MADLCTACLALCLLLLLVAPQVSQQLLRRPLQDLAPRLAYSLLVAGLHQHGRSVGSPPHECHSPTLTRPSALRQTRERLAGWLAADVVPVLLLSWW